jgi:hypothetical protein
MLQHVRNQDRNNVVFKCKEPVRQVKANVPHLSGQKLPFVDLLAYMSVLFVVLHDDGVYYAIHNDADITR